VVRDPHVATVERYLARVRDGLRGLSEREIEDILRELRSHVDERLEAPGASLEEVLRALGEPAKLASLYRADQMMERAVCSHSPIEIFHSLYLMGRRMPSSYVMVILAGLGYAWGFVLIGLSIDKLLAPHDVGLSYVPGHWASFQIMVDGRGPTGSRELLGWWFVPVALAVGVAFLLGTNQVGLWWIRRWRGERTPNQARKIRRQA
jgi:hypothetical protein